MPASARAALRSASSTPARNGSIDYLRFLGALGIIWFHLDLPGAGYGLAALPMFVALFVCFGVGRDIASLNRRLLYPWLAWSGVFVLAKLAQAWVSGAPILSEFEWWMLLTGPSIHLWFLPFSYGFVVILSQMRRQTRGAAIVVLVPCSIWLANADLPAPFAQWATVIPAACMGLVLSHLGTRSRRAHLIGWASVAIAALMVVSGQDHVAFQYALGISTVLLALAFQVQASPLSRVLAETSFGVYLLHPLVFALVLALPVGGLALQASIVIIASILMTQMMRRVTPALV